jgi:hypothetical protein
MSYSHLPYWINVNDRIKMRNTGSIFVTSVNEAKMFHGRKKTVVPLSLIFQNSLHKIKIPELVTQPPPRTH